MKKCIHCLCNTCGGMYRCDTIPERIIDIDLRGKECRPVIKCINYSKTKDDSVIPRENCILHDTVPDK